MPRFKETKFLPYDAEQLFHLVADVERYPEFLPWCKAVQVHVRDSTCMTAEFSVKYGLLATRFTSIMTLDFPRTISARHVAGPFSHLNNSWTFEPAESGCNVLYHADFATRSVLMRAALGRFSNESLSRTVALFERRAHQLFGDGASYSRS